MRGTKAKALRKKVYGGVFSPRVRSYKTTTTGQVVNTGKRAEYKVSKKYAGLEALDRKLLGD